MNKKLVKETIAAQIGEVPDTDIPIFQVWTFTQSGKRKLSPDEREIIRRAYNEHSTPVAILARNYNVTERRIHQIVRSV